MPGLCFHGGMQKYKLQMRADAAARQQPYVCHAEPVQTQQVAEWGTAGRTTSAPPTRRPRATPSAPPFRSPCSSVAVVWQASGGGLAKARQGNGVWYHCSSRTRVWQAALQQQPCAWNQTLRMIAHQAPSAMASPTTSSSWPKGTLQATVRIGGELNLAAWGSWKDERRQLGGVACGVLPRNLHACGLAATKCAEGCQANTGLH